MCGPGRLSAQEPAAKYLSSDLADRLSTIVQGWGGLGMDTSVNPLHQPAMKLRIKDKEYQHGLGHHASGEIVVDLAGQFQTFQAEVGIQWQGGQDQASVIFRVLVDDKKVFDSGVMREGDAPRPIKISVAGADELTLVADDAGDGITCDCANWADARLDSRSDRCQATAGDGRGHRPVWPRRHVGSAADEGHGRRSRPGIPGRRHAAASRRAAGIRWHVTACPYRATPGASACGGTRTACCGKWPWRLSTRLQSPPRESIQLQTWSGESAWQGTWEPVSVAPEQVENRLVWNFSPQSSIARHAEGPLGVLRCQETRSSSRACTLTRARAG